MRPGPRPGSRPPDRLVWLALPGRQAFAGRVGPPAVLRLVAEQLAGLVDREQRLVLADLARVRDVRERRGQQLGVRAPGDRVGVGDDEDVGAGAVGLERPPDRLRPVAAVDVGPEVPLALPWVGVEAGERRVVL